MKLVMGLPKIELWNEANDKLIHIIEDVNGYTYDFNNDMIYVDVVYKPEDNNIEIDRYVMKLYFKQYSGMPQLEQIDDYVEIHQVEYSECRLVEAKVNECVTWRHRFFVYPRG